MATEPIIVNNPSPDNTNNGIGFAIGALVLLVVIILFFFYGLPYVRSLVSSPQINVPDHFNVNVQNQSK